MSSVIGGVAGEENGDCGCSFAEREHVVTLQTFPHTVI